MGRLDDAPIHREAARAAAALIGAPAAVVVRFPDVAPVRVWGTLEVAPHELLRPEQAAGCVLRTGDVVAAAPALGFAFGAAVPLRSGKRAWGALVVGSRIPPSLEQVRRLERFAAICESRLVWHPLDPTEAEAQLRRGLASVLHDGVMQDLSSVRQDLAEAIAGEPLALERAITGVDLALHHLRTAVGDLFAPTSRPFGDLREQVEAIVASAAARGEFTTSLSLAVGPPQQVHGLALRLLREWLRNAVEHAHAGNVRVTFVDGHGDTVVEVSDDGVGLPADRLRSALLLGHIGIASSADRVRSAGGDLTIEPGPEGGTTIRAILPHGGSA